jgi:protein-disulfide isomerase
LAGVCGSVVAASAPPRARAETFAEHALGPEDAKVTVIEYASMTCPHCAAFHHETFPRIRESYIDTGKIRFVFRDFPLDSSAVRAAALAHCAGAERYFGFVEVLFQTQSTWAGGGGGTEALKKIGRLGGLDDATIDACFADQALTDAIIGSRERGEQEFGVESTPSLILNGVLYQGGKDFEALAKAIDALLPAD